MRSSLEESLQRLKSQKVWGYLLHCYSRNYDLRYHQDEMLKLRNLGLVTKIGFSSDSLEEFPKDSSWADIIEIPSNIIFDVPLLSHQILIVNGIHRLPNGSEKLKRYSILFPKQVIIGLSGSKSIHHLNEFRRWVKSVNKTLSY